MEEVVFTIKTTKNNTHEGKGEGTFSNLRCRAITSPNQSFIASIDEQVRNTLRYINSNQTVNSPLVSVMCSNCIHKVAFSFFFGQLTVMGIIRYGYVIKNSRSVLRTPSLAP